MHRILRTDSTHTGFIRLVKMLDADLAIRDGDDHAFYSQFNSIGLIRHVIVITDDKEVLGCGAIKPYNNTTAEVKRMFTLPARRGEGLASSVLRELEKWAVELGYSTCILETGIRQPEAIALYKKNGYICIDNYGQYAGVETSVCFEKKLN